MLDELYLRRCFQLASLGLGKVSPNPLVGAVLVCEDRIIGEGWHARWGEAHAEVRCIQSVAPENQSLIPYSTLYCNLEPCAHFGKTPPCADLILAHRIPTVVVSNTDPNPLVAGKGLEKLRQSGTIVRVGLLEAEGQWLNRTFFTWIIEKRPRIILKWAQSADGFLGKTGARTAISDRAALRLVHRWRSETDAILVGTNTALLDNPRLDNRFYFGKKPLRIAFDLQGKIPATHHLLDDSGPTWIYGPERVSETPPFENTRFIPAEKAVSLADVLDHLKAENCSSILVEGGAHLHQQFLSSGLWDEIRVLENNRFLNEGIRAPGIPGNAVLKEETLLGADRIRIFAR